MGFGLVRSAAAAAGDLAGARGRRKERERKEGGRCPKAVFSRVGERRPPTIPPNAILGRGGVPIVHAAYDRMALAPSPISHGYSFLVFAIGGLGFFLFKI